MELNRSSWECLLYDITDGATSYKFQYLIITIFIVVLSIAKESVPRGFCAFNSSKVNLNIFPLTYTYEE
jgi:hypothetical protein